MAHRRMWLMLMLVLASMFVFVLVFMHVSGLVSMFFFVFRLGLMLQAVLTLVFVFVLMLSWMLMLNPLLMLMALPVTGTRHRPACVPPHWLAPREASAHPAVHALRPCAGPWPAAGHRVCGRSCRPPLRRGGFPCRGRPLPALARALELGWGSERGRERYALRPDGPCSLFCARCGRSAKASVMLERCPCEARGRWPAEVESAVRARASGPRLIRSAGLGPGLEGPALRARARALLHALPWRRVCPSEGTSAIIVVGAVVRAMMGAVSVLPSLIQSPAQNVKRAQSWSNRDRTWSR